MEDERHQGTAGQVSGWHHWVLMVRHNPEVGWQAGELVCRQAGRWASGQTARHEGMHTCGQAARLVDRYSTHKRSGLLHTPAPCCSCHHPVTLQGCSCRDSGTVPPSPA